MVRQFQFILGIKFFTGDLEGLLEACPGQFVVVPSGPSLVDLPTDAAYREARARGYDGDRIVLMGASLGTGVATALAATHEAAALVLEAPYLSALDVASTHYPFFPVSWLMLDRFRSDLAIRHVHVPVLMIHGEEDDVIPISSAKRLFELAKEPKTFMSVRGGGHLVLELADVFPCVCEWIDEKTLISRL